jgi:hypothetical protein
MRKIELWAGVIALCLMVLLPLTGARGAKAPRLDLPTLKGWLSDPQVIVLDVRDPQDWQSSSKKILGAMREDPYDVKTWAPLLPRGKKIVLYCA